MAAPVTRRSKRLGNLVIVDQGETAHVIGTTVVFVSAHSPSTSSTLWEHVESVLRRIFAGGNVYAHNFRPCMSTTCPCNALSILYMNPSTRKYHKERACTAISTACITSRTQLLKVHLRQLQDVLIQSSNCGLPEAMLIHNIDMGIHVLPRIPYYVASIAYGMLGRQESRSKNMSNFQPQSPRNMSSLTCSRAPSSRAQRRASLCHTK